jgi:hypothetical protein
MTMRPGMTILCLFGMLALLAAALPLAGSPVSASPSSVSVGKKVCKTVTKKVHGKKIKVKVCKAVKATPTPTPTPLPPDQEATKLVDALTAASDAAGRYTALLQIMTAMNLGVSTPGRKALVPKAAMGANDFYLYDFELHGLATILGTHQTGSLDQLTALLTGGGITVGGKPLDNGTVHAALRAWAAGAVSQPGNPISLIALLVRDLGLKEAQPYDLSQDVTDASLSFDPLQLLLIAAAIATSPSGGSTTRQSVRLDVPAEAVWPRVPEAPSWSSSWASSSSIVQNGWSAGSGVPWLCSYSPRPIVPE